MSWHNKDKPNLTRWRRVRLQVLDRDGWACVRCGRKGRIEVDHKKPLEEGGEMYSLSNLAALCRGCHIEKTRQENAARRPPQPEIEAWKAFIEERIANGV